jgi:hypothetical protein
VAQTPSFEPRGLLVRPGVWGRDPDPRLRRATSLDQAGQVAWAYRQNLLVCALEELREFHGNSIADLSVVLGGSYSQTWRKLSGSVPAPYADMVRWEWLIRSGRPSGVDLVSSEVRDALGDPELSLRSVAEPSVHLVGWPLPKGNQKGGRDWTPPSS